MPGGSIFRSVPAQAAGIKSSSLNDVYKALTTREGLAGWWTIDTQGENKVGGILQFRPDQLHPRLPLCPLCR
jgi:hypothetical protein